MWRIILDSLKNIINDIMRRFIYFIFIAFSVYSCGKEVDYEPECNNCEEKDFVIKNDIEHNVKIVVGDKSSSNRDTFTIIYGDSLIRSSRISPFGGNLYVVIDDTLEVHNDAKYLQYNLNVPSSYDTIEVGNNYYKMRYVIDEDFYEYAKTHPYMGE